MIPKTLIEQTRELHERFSLLNSRPWTIETYVVELLGEVGTLADTIMIQEKYRECRVGQELDLEDDIVDIIFILIHIADHYNIDLNKAYEEMLRVTAEKLNQQEKAQQEKAKN